MYKECNIAKIAVALFFCVILLLTIFPTVVMAETFPVVVDETNFPDEAWQLYVNANFAGGDNILTQKEAAAVIYIDVKKLGITDLTGIEYFTNTVALYCFDNSLTFLDLSGLANLKNLNCSNNSLTTLDLSELANLKSLNCQDNSLTTLDLGNSKLWTLFCSNNSLLEVVLEGATYHSGDNQIRIISMVSDSKGAYVSETSYFLHGKNYIDGLDVGVTYDENTGLFHTENIPMTSHFNSKARGNEFQISGTLVFSLYTEPEAPVPVLHMPAPPAPEAPAPAPPAPPVPEASITGAPISETPTTKPPQTGDSSNGWIWVIVLLSSVFVLVGLFIWHRREHSEINEMDE